MDNFLLKNLLIEYDKKRQKAILEAENRKYHLYKKFPQIEELDLKISKSSIMSVKNILLLTPDKKQEKLNELENKTNKLLIEKKELLKKLNIPDNYLSPVFECSDCSDTGYIEKDSKTIMCSCLKQKLFDLEYNKSNIGNLEKENFDNFNFNLYSNSSNYDLYNSNYSPRENIKVIYNFAQNFIKNFDNPEEKNLMFLGPTGLGKTFLSNCIAKELLSNRKNSTLPNSSCHA